MRIKDMACGIRYIVTKGGCTLSVGDRVLLEPDERLFCCGAGWLTKAQWVSLRNEVEPDVEYYKDKMRKLRDELDQTYEELKQATSLSVVPKMEK